MKKVDCVVVGCGYVGFTLGLHMATKGLRVVGVDIDQEKIRNFNQGVTHIVEPGINDALGDAIKKGFISFQTTPPQAASTWIIATSYIPSKPEIFLSILESLPASSEPPLFMIRGTIPVGFSSSHVIPLLEKKFGGRIGEKFYLASCPERTLSGAALEELSSLPQLVGGDSRSVAKATELFEKAGIDCLPLPSLEGGELAKVFANYARLVEFNLANFLGLLCHHFGISEESMIKQMTSGYGRLNFLKRPGPGVGGFCLPKDSLVLYDGLKEEFNRSGFPQELMDYPKHQFELNEKVIDYHSKRVRVLTENCKNILACGVAFKGVPRTDDTRDSVGLTIVRTLKEAGKNVTVLDLAVSPAKIAQLGLKGISLPADLVQFDAILLLNNDPEYKNILYYNLSSAESKPVKLYDPWRLLVTGNESIFQESFFYQSVKNHLVECVVS